jgi:prepilin-type N-terminal cleavage/methylation domain-containing protein
MLTGRAKDQDRDKGFTLIEVLITGLVLSIITAIAGSALISLTTEGNRNLSAVVQEQTASTVMAQLAADIRSAVSVTFPSNASPSTEVELGEPSLGDPSKTTEVLWIYSGTTLTREQMNSSNNWTQAGPQATNVVNTSSQAVFTYYDATGTSIPNGVTPPIPSTDQSTVETNATAISVNLYVSSTRSGVSTYNQTEEVALTNLLNTNQPAGEGT